MTQRHLSVSRGANGRTQAYWGNAIFIFICIMILGFLLQQIT